MEKSKDNIKENNSFIKCSRCKYKVKSRHKRNRNRYKDICSHCINEYLCRKRSKTQINKKKIEYVKMKSSTKCNKESFKVVLSKLVELLENNMILVKAFDLSKYVPYKSILSDPEKCYQRALKTLHEPKIDIMFKEAPVKLEAVESASLKSEQIKEQGTRSLNIEQHTNVQYKRVHSLADISPEHFIENDEKVIPLQLQRKIINITNKINVNLEQSGQVKDNLTCDCICKDKLITCLTESIENITEDVSSKNIKYNNIDSLPTVQMFDSAEFLNRSISELTERTFDHNFNYYFPKQDCVKSVMRTYKSSSEIIKEVMEMLSARSELKKMNKDLKLDKERRHIKYTSKDKIKVKSHRKVTNTPESTSAKSKTTKPKGIKPNISKTTPKQEHPKKEKLDSKKEPTKREVLSAEKKKVTDPKPNAEKLKSNGLHERKKEIKDWMPPPLPFAQNKLEVPKKNLPTKKQDEKRKSQDITAMKLINVSKIQIRIPDNILLQLMKKKQAERGRFKPRPKSLSELKVSPILLKRHQHHKFVRSFYALHCMVCENSEMDLDIDNILYSKYKKPKKNKMIIGTKVFKNVRPVKIAPIASEFKSMLFKTTLESDNLESSKIIDLKSPAIPKKKTEEDDKGVVRYALSDRSFIEKGWTMLPTEKVVRRMNVYRMKPAHPEFCWFKHNKDKKVMHYETGEKLAEFNDDGKGSWFYRNGRKALDYYDAEEINAQQRFVIYSNGESDSRGRSRPLTILATFDYLGNGIVFDHCGKIRLKYNQTEGVILDRSIGPVSHWKWHTLNDPPVLQQIMTDTHLPHKDPDILKFGNDTKPKQVHEEMIEIELDNLIREKRKKLSQKFQPFQIRMKALKINENFSLKVLGQSMVYLIYRDGTTNLKLNIGMILDHKEIVDTDTAELGVVSNNLESFPARSTSLENLQKSVAYAQRVERSRVERDRRIRPTMSQASADKLTAGASKPLRQPFRSAPSETTVTTECYCGHRNSLSKNVYYDTRLI